MTEKITKKVVEFKESLIFVDGMALQSKENIFLRKKTVEMLKEDFQVFLDKYGKIMRKISEKTLKNRVRKSINNRYTVTHSTVINPEFEERYTLHLVLMQLIFSC